MNLTKILMILLIGANCSFPTIKPCEICSISLKNDYCYCALFDLNEGKLTAISESEKKPLEYCNRFVGMSATSWGNIVNYLDAIYTWKKKKFKKEGINRDTHKESDVLTLDQY